MRPNGPRLHGGTHAISVSIAQGLTYWYVAMENGAASPARWQI
jgi:hypothetical protein